MTMTAAGIGPPMMGNGTHLLRAGMRAATAARSATSPSAVEATLASISDEVMKEAIARRDRDALLKELNRS